MHWVQLSGDFFFSPKKNSRSANWPVKEEKKMRVEKFEGIHQNDYAFRF